MASEPELLTHRVLMIDDNPAIHADYRKILTGHDEGGMSAAEAALFGAQRLTSLGYACSVAIAMPQDAIEPIRRMCKWIVDEECDPDVVIPLWRLGQATAGTPQS